MTRTKTPCRTRKAAYLRVPSHLRQDASAVVSAKGHRWLRTVGGSAAYAAGATTFALVSDGSTNGIYKLEASATGFVVQPFGIMLPPDAQRDFNFAP
jgi:hypothetical protein